MSKKHVFIVGLNDFNLNKLTSLPNAQECEFHAALNISEYLSDKRFDMKELIDLAAKRIENADVPVDAIVSFYDFPTTLMVPVLAEQFGARAPSLKNVVKCEHKYWSRVEQQKIIPGNIPRFAAFDPFDDLALEKLPLDFPFWIKPFKSFLSFLAYRVNNENDYIKVLPEIREKIDYIRKPFNYLLETYGMPAHITNMKESFIAEEIMSGRMCTAEGHVFDGEVEVYGIVDSIREPDSSSFARYEYPSSLPQSVQFRIADIVRRVISGIGLNNSVFNVEFFWDRSTDHISLLEINPRISQSHTDLFEKVHGVSHHAVMLDIALGRKPATLENNGEFKVAAKFMYRVFEDGIVKKAPDENQIRQIARELPGTIVIPFYKAGQRLSESLYQDSYSYLLANIYIGGRDPSDLLGKYNRCLEILDLEIEHDEHNVTSADILA